jgi:hypothetical protein
MPLHICVEFRLLRKTVSPLERENESAKRESGGEERGGVLTGYIFNGRNDKGYIFTDGSGQRLFLLTRW